MKTGRKNYNLKKRGKGVLTKMTKKTQKIRRGMKSLPKMEKETFFRKKDYAESQRVF